MVSQSYLYNGNSYSLKDIPILGETVLILEWGSVSYLEILLVLTLLEEFLSTKLQDVRQLLLIEGIGARSAEKPQYL